MEGKKLRSGLVVPYADDAVETSSGKIRACMRGCQGKNPVSVSSQIFEMCEITKSVNSYDTIGSGHENVSLSNRQGQDWF